ncbi:hypothetical protein CLV24_108120 [Pontibacter ummariensis]|uniref:SpoIIAA-like n=2 Tax=Pontibacter ummariensis TaxID=1610492 RepID=A0A239F8D4_9BACT|nr:hypothetical protein CLV24_108120 [Pontibacter ummariensis]SNS53146.1 hypothetical protein SAMN06296052_10865 [Pontibacter ummariensis]
MPVIRSNAFAVEFDGVRGQLCLSCWDTPASEELQEGLEKALLYAEKNRVKHWLFDFRAIGTLCEEQEAWLQANFFSRMMKTMGAGNFVATVLSSECYQELLEEAGKAGLRSYNSFIIIHTFCDPVQARDWLNRSVLEPVS